MYTQKLEAQLTLHCFIWPWDLNKEDDVVLSCCCWSREEIHVPVHLLMSEMRPSDDERWHNINCEEAWTASIDCTSLTCYKCCWWWFRGLCHISLPYLIRCSTNPNFNINLFLFTNKTSYNICMIWCGKYNVTVLRHSKMVGACLPSTKWWIVTL